MESYTTTVPASLLAENINNPDWIVFDCQASPSVPRDGRNFYEGGHIPGAIHICLDDDLSSPVTKETGRHPLPDAKVLIKKLKDWGVNKNTQIVAYDDNNGVMSVRLWWTLRHWFKHERAAILDGGMNAWQSIGQPLSTDEPPKRPAGDFDANPDDNAWVSTDELVDIIKAGKNLILDARAGNRYRGEEELVDAQAGHIPSSISFPMTENLDENGNVRPREELYNRFKDINQPVIHSCASGVTACTNMLAMEIAGLPVGRLYPGSWSEWIRDPKRTTATGEEPGQL